MNRKYFLMLITASILVLGSCKKNKVEPTPEPTRTELSLDSIFLYAKQVYYWNDQLPSYETFNPRKYKSGSNSLDNYKSALFGIAGYSLNKYDVYQSSPKYSYISDKTTHNPSATGIFINNETLAVDLSGNGHDVGIRLVSYLLDNTRTKYLPFVTAVYENSPAEKAGIKRGSVITKVNGKAYGANYTNEGSELNDALKGDNVELELINYITKATSKVTLKKVVYNSSPIYAKKVFTAGAKKIGYVNLARFSMLSSPRVPSDVDIDPVFNEFAAAGISDLIVDLRYNGGGYVLTAEYLANLIAPTSANGKVMYVEHYNSLMKKDGATILKNQPILDLEGKVQYVNGKIANYHENADYTEAGNTARFDKKPGSLSSVQNVVFLVTENTASSSELLITALKPYVNVKLVGAPTYGKPIGFWPIVIENRYEVYYSMFESKNALGQGGYYTGLVPDYDENETSKYPDLWDDVTRDFGDVNEAYLAQAFKILAPGVTIQSSNPNERLAQSTGKGLNTLNNTKVFGKRNAGNGEFVGMVGAPRLK